MKTIVLVFLATLCTAVHSQSEPLDSAAQSYWGFEWRIEGCIGNMGPAFQRCREAYPAGKDLYSEAQIQEYIKGMSIMCNLYAVRSYYSCLGPGPE